jgi:hypothetical protein
VLFHPPISSSNWSHVLSGAGCVAEYAYFFLFSPSK